jgi:hypothetical protein
MQKGSFHTLDSRAFGDVKRHYIMRATPRPVNEDATAAGFTLAASTGAAMAQDIILGIITAAFAAWAAAREDHPVASWIVAIAGLWTLLSPGVHYGVAHAAHTNNLVVGVIVLILGFANAVFRRSPIRVHG